MKKIIMAAPFAPNGRYNGGITFVANEFANCEKYLEENRIELTRFETCRIVRKDGEMGKFNFLNIKNTLKIYSDISDETKQSGADILYYHTSCELALLKDLLAVSKVKRKNAVKTIIHIHFAEYSKIMTGNQAIDGLILKLMKKYVDHIVFLSKSTMNEFISHGIDRKKCSVIYNFSSLNYSVDEVNKKLCSDMNIPQFLFVGSIDSRKGIFETLECMKNIDTQFVFHICGACSTDEDAKLFDSYREQLGDKIVFHGYVSGEEKKNIYLNSDVLVLPSYAEGLPIVILEAYAAACSVITTNVGGISEVVDQSNGIVLSPGDKEALRGALKACIENKNGIIKKHQKNNYDISEYYSLQTFIKNVSDVCEKTLRS